MLLVTLHFGLALSYLPVFFTWQYLNFGIISSAIHICLITYVLILNQRIKKSVQSEILENQLAARQQPLPLQLEAPSDYQSNEDFHAPPPEYQPHWYDLHELQKSQRLQHSMQESATDANTFK
mgnify:CR=1 FL=1